MVHVEGLARVVAAANTCAPQLEVYRGVDGPLLCSIPYLVPKLIDSSWEPREGTPANTGFRDWLFRARPGSNLVHPDVTSWPSCAPYHQIHSETSTLWHRMIFTSSLNLRPLPRHIGFG